MADKTPPEVRQNQDQESDTFGSTAVASGKNNWGVMNPGVANPNGRGGHWATDEEVEGWKKLS